MKDWFLKGIACAVVGAALFGGGMLLAAKRGESAVYGATQRFIPQGEGEALDTKFGKTCKTVEPLQYSSGAQGNSSVAPLPGFTVDPPGTPIQPIPPQCDDLAKQ